ncbi:MAG: hypothetical protein ACHQD8_04085 [Chitinophagales bacterium]
MRLSHPQYITDDTGKKLSVILPFKEYERIIKELEEKLSNSPHTKLKNKVSSLRGKMSPMTNEQIDQQFNNMRNEWQKDF